MSEPRTWVVVPHRAEWPALFAQEVILLAKIFHGTDAVIEHIP